MQGVLEIMRVFGMVAAGCATAAAILGYHVLQRSRSARLALTLLAVPLFLSGMVTGGFLSSVVAAAAVMLWFQPSRDWFNGVVRESRRDAGRRCRVDGCGDSGGPGRPPPPGADAPGVPRLRQPRRTRPRPRPSRSPGGLAPPVRPRRPAARRAVGVRC